jgi:hypothetical protein
MPRRTLAVRPSFSTTTPCNVLNPLFDNLPLASNADHKTLENIALNLVQISRRLFGAERVLFYLGENGFVRKFR